MPQLVVFDWDGTLADSVSKIIACKHYLAEKYEVDKPTEEQVRHVLGMEFKEAMKICFPSVSSEMLDNLCNEFRETMQLKEYQGEMFPGSVEMLRALKARNYKLAIATSKSRKELDSAITHNKLEGIFDITCCGAEYKEKPDPTMLRHIMKTLCFSSDECIMVGDTTSDVNFGTNAKVKTICVTFGSHSKEKLEQLKPFAFIDSFDQLETIIDRLFIKVS
jgi:phosphoglycolate phosphatase